MLSMFRWICPGTWAPSINTKAPWEWQSSANCMILIEGNDRERKWKEERETHKGRSRNWSFRGCQNKSHAYISLSLSLSLSSFLSFFLHSYISFTDSYILFTETIRPVRQEELVRGSMWYERMQRGPRSLHLHQAQALRPVQSRIIA